MVRKFLAALVCILITAWAVPSDGFMLLGRRLGFLGNDGYTKLLLHFDGTDASTAINDTARSGHVMTAAANAQLDTAQKKFGSASLLLDGTGDQITCPIDADFNFGAGNFTIDFWVRFNSVAASQYFFAIKPEAGDVITCDWDQALTRLSFTATVGGVTKANYYSIFEPTAGPWYHIAIVRNATSLLVFLNGISQLPTESTAISTNDIGAHDGGATDLFYIGSASSTLYINGWMDEFRVSKGIARWTVNFTPSTQEYR